jgi:hypothetical protein
MGIDFSSFFQEQTREELSQLVHTHSYEGILRKTSMTIIVNNNYHIGQPMRWGTRSPRYFEEFFFEER